MAVRGCPLGTAQDCCEWHGRRGWPRHRVAVRSALTAGWGPALIEGCSHGTVGRPSPADYGRGPARVAPAGPGAGLRRRGGQLRPAPAGRGWCWRRRRCRRTTPRTGARLLAWPSCGPDWRASGTALPSPTPAGSPPPWTSSARHPRSSKPPSRHEHPRGCQGSGTSRPAAASGSTTRPASPAQFQRHVGIPPGRYALSTAAGRRRRNRGPGRQRAGDDGWLSSSTCRGRARRPGCSCSPW